MWLEKNFTLGKFSLRKTSLKSIWKPDISSGPSLRSFWNYVFCVYRLLISISCRFLWQNCISLFGDDIGWFQSVDGHSNIFFVDNDIECFVRTFCDRKWSVICHMQCFAVNEFCCGCLVILAKNPQKNDGKNFCPLLYCVAFDCCFKLLMHAFDVKLWLAGTGCKLVSKS